MAPAIASGADPEPWPRPEPHGRGGLDPTGPIDSHPANRSGHPNSFSSGSSGISAHMQQKINVLLMQHQATLERDRIVCSILPPPLLLQHMSSDLARLPGWKALLSPLWEPGAGAH
eukprot:2131090-Pleurochrysis_carterae.AAC.1